MAIVSQKTFPWMTTFEFQNKFSLKYVPWCLFDNTSIGSDNGLAPKKWQTIIWTDNGMFYCRIYASFGINELMDGIASVGSH